MKKKLLTLFGLLLIFATGCFKYDATDAISDLEKKYKNLKAYHLEGELEILNNEDVFNYDVDVYFKKDDNYRVSLKNKSNNHEQIILKNYDGVYVLTPSLNKSFKFQSDWPYNNSQVYLIKSIIDDIKNDKERNLVEKEDGFIITSKVNYPNNRKLISQIITTDKDLNLKEAKVVDESEITQMKMTFTKIDTSPSIDDSVFDLNSIMKNQTPTKTPTPTPTTSPSPTPDSSGATESTSVLEDFIYPLYIPSGTALSNQEKITTSTGERVIMTFDGEKPFLLVEETSSVAEEFEIIPTFGEPCILSDTIAALTENSITWASGGIDYYLVSDVMSQEELLDIARSVSVIPTMK